MRLKPDIPIEDPVEHFPGSVYIPRKHQPVWIICGKSIWRILETLANSKNPTDGAVQQKLNEIKSTSHKSLFRA